MWHTLLPPPLWLLKISTKNDICKEGEGQAAKFHSKASISIAFNFTKLKYSDAPYKWESNI